MSRVLIFMSQVTSHYYSVLPLADWLKREGWVVAFAGHESAAGTVAAAGHDFIGSRWEWRTKRRPEYRAGTLCRQALVNWLQARPADFAAPTQWLRQVLAEFRPDLVLVDAYQMVDQLILLSLHRHVVMITSTINPRESSDFPPSSSHHGFARTPVSRLRNWLLWQRHHWFGRLQNAARRGFMPCRRDLVHLLGLSGRTLADLDRRRYKVWAVKGVPELLTAPEQWDSPAQLGRDQHYVRPPHYAARRGHRADPRFERDHAAAWSLRRGDFIYCSIGTTAESVEMLGGFLAKLAEACAAERLTAVFSVPSEAIAEALRRFDGVHAYTWVDQVDLLQRCRLFVTHGGINSITEAIAHEAPLLVVPSSDRLDQPGNAARVEHHGIGRRTSADAPVESLRRDLRELWDEPGIRTRMRELRHAVFGPAGASEAAQRRLFDRWNQRRYPGTPMSTSTRTSVLTP